MIVIDIIVLEYSVQKFGTLSRKYNQVSHMVRISYHEMIVEMLLKW